MLIKVKTLKGYKLNGLDGEIGKVSEIYFDDQHWAVRYLVASNGNWLTGRQVLISPYALTGIDREAEHININLTKKQIEDSPSLDSDKPVTRQFEEAFYKYYSWPMYWGGPHMWGYYPYIEREKEKWIETTIGNNKGDPHLRSTLKVRGYHVQARDGEVGHIEDFIIDDETWAIRYLIVDTKNFWPGEDVLISPQWIERVSWTDSKVFVNQSRQMIKEAPDYLETFELTREYETRLYRHYNHQGYWTH
jgi:hypothetical protein